MYPQVAFLHHLPKVSDHLPRGLAVGGYHIQQPVYRAGIPILGLQPDWETGDFDLLTDFQINPLLPVLPVMISVRHAQAMPVAGGFKEDTSVHLSHARSVPTLPHLSRLPGTCAVLAYWHLR